MRDRVEQRIPCAPPRKQRRVHNQLPVVALATVWLLVTSAALVLSGNTATAKYFDFATTISVSPISPGTATVFGNGSDSIKLKMNSGSGNSILLTGDSISSFHDNPAFPGTDEVIANVSSHVTKKSGLDSNVDFTFAITLRIRDFLNQACGGAPQGTGDFTVSGEIKGSIGPNRQLNLSTLLNPLITPASQVIGDRMYTVTYVAYAPPGPSFAGVIDVHVSSAAIHVPEPSTLRLAAAAIVAMLPLLRRRRPRAV
jgi:hypothetical protein